MSHSEVPKQERTSTVPDLPPELSEALSAVRKNPLDLEAWENLNEACRDLDRPDEAAALYTEILDGTLSGETLSGEHLEDVGRSAADFCEEWFEDTGPVLEMLGRVLELEPTQQWAFDRMTVLLTAGARWDELLKAYDVALEAAENDAKKQALYEEASKIARDFAAQHDRASDYLKQLLLLRLQDEQLAATTERRFDEQNRHEDLIEIWTARLSVLDTSTALRTRLQIASRYFEHLHDPTRALSAVDDFLRAQGEEQAAVELLERIANTQEADSAARKEALVRLDQIHASAGRWPEVISVAERALLLAETDEEKAVLHRKALTLYSNSEQFEPALEHCGALLKIQASAEDVRRQARLIAERIGLMDRFADAIVDAAGTAEDPLRRVALLVEAADVRASVLADASGAIDLYFRIEADEASSEETRLLACQNLGPLLEENGRQNELLDVSERWAKLEASVGARRVILGKAANLALQLGQAERALSLWGWCLRDDPKDDEALSLQIEILTSLARHADLVEVFQARAVVGQDQERRRTDLMAAAAVYAEQLSDLKQAISMWRLIEERFGRDDQTVDSLVDLLSSAGLHEEVVELLNEAIAEELDAQRVVAQLAFLGDTLRLHVKKVEAALSAYARGLKIDPRHETAREGLRALCETPDLAHEASESLVAGYRAAQDTALIIEIAELRIQHAPTRGFQSEILLEVARIFEADQDLSQALSALRRAFSLSPSDSTEAELHRLGEATGHWDVVDAAYAEAIEGCEDQERVAVLYVMKGKVEEHRLGNSAAATASFVEALQRNAAQLGVARLLIRSAHQARLFSEAAWSVVEHSRFTDHVEPELLETFSACTSEHGDWDSALDGMADRIASADTMSARVAHDIKKQLSIWYRDQVQDPDSAELVLKRAVADYREEESLRMLAELQRRAPGRPLVATLCTLSEVCDDDLFVLREAGEVALTAVGDSALALPILEKTLSGSSEAFLARGPVDSAKDIAEICAWSTDRLVELALEAKDFERGIQLLKTSAQLPFAEQEQIALLYRAAQVASDGTLDEEAVDICEVILKAQPYHEGAITLLSDLHEKSGRLEELLQLRKRELLLDRPLERRLFLRLDQARVMGELAGDPDERLHALHENLHDKPGHEDTISALDDIFTASGQFQNLVQVYEEQADALSSASPARAARLWERAGILAHEQLKDEARLVAAFKKSAAAKPSIFVVDQLAQIAESHEQWDEQVSWLTLRLNLTPEASEAEEGPEDRRVVVVRLGEALIRTEELADASQMIEAELAKDPGADASRQLLAQIYRELTSWEALCALLEAGVQYAPDDTQRIAYLREAAVVNRKQLGNVEAAIPLLESAIQLDYSDRSLRLMLADTFRICSHFSEARELLVALLDEFGRRRTRERAMVHMQLAKIAEATGNLDEAVEQADSAAKIERSDAAILMLVGQLAKQKGALDRAEQAYRTLALIAGRRSSSPNNSASDEDGGEEVGESSVLFELYRIAQEKGEMQQARELLDSAIDVASRDETEAMRLSRALAAFGQLDLLVNALQSGIDSGLKGEAAARMLITKANVLEQGDRAEEAFAARLRALSESPSDLRLLDVTQKLAERLGLSDDLWIHVTHLAEQFQNQPKLAGELWFRAGHAAEINGDLQTAASLFEASQSTGFKPRRAFLALDQVLDESAEPERVRRALKTFASAPGADSNPAVFADALYRLAEMDIVQGELSEATSLLGRAMDLDPQSERVVGLLEPLARDGRADQQTQNLFLSVCKKAASEDVLLFAFLRSAQQEDATPAVVVEAIALARKLDDKEALRTLLSRAIELSVNEPQAVAQLIVERAAMAREDGDFAQEAHLIRLALPLYEGEELFELRLRLATCLAEDQGTPAEGLPIFEELYAAEQSDGRVWRPLLSVYRSMGATDKIVEIIDRIADQVTDDADLEALKLERVRLMMRDGLHEEAETELRSVLDAHPQMAEAASLLVKILRAQERWDELRQLLRQLLDDARGRQDAKMVGQLSMDLARLVEAEDREEAISILVSGLELTKQNRDLLVYLLGLYTEEDNQSERADVMEHLVALCSGDEAKQLTLNLIELRRFLDDPFGIGRALEIGVRAVPQDVELAEMLLAHLRESQEHGPLADALMVRASQLTGEEAVSRYAEAGALYDEFLGEPQKAAAAFDAAFQADPTTALHLEKAVSLMVNVGEVEGALAKLGSAIEGCEEFLVADLLQLRASVISREKMMDREAMILASSDLARALAQFIPEEQEQELQQMRVFVLTELRSLHQAEGDIQEERMVVIELSRLLLATGNVGGGLDALASWVRDHEDDLEIARRLGEKAIELGDPATAVFGYQKLVEGSEGEAKIPAILSLSDAAMAAEDHTTARMALEDGLAIEPQNSDVLRRLRAMYEASGAFGELAAILQGEADRQKEPAARFELLVQVGDLYLKAGDPDAASSSYQAAKDLDVNNSFIVSKLAEVFLNTGESERAREILDEAVAEHGKRRSPELALLQRGLARVEEAAGNRSGMFAWLEAALISDRNNAAIATELAVRAQEAELYDVAIKALQNLTLSKAEGGMTKAEAYFRQAQIAFAQGDAKKSLLMARRAHSADASLPGVEDLLAQLT